MYGFGFSGQIGPGAGGLLDTLIAAGSPRLRIQHQAGRTGSRPDELPGGQATTYLLDVTVCFFSLSRALDLFLLVVV
jgi:hypothetical protein